MLVFIFLLTGQVLAQNPTPCPSIFAYEPRITEQDRWYGRITLNTPIELHGIWLRIRLDKRAEILGNWFGETSSTDNTEFLIKNRSYHFEPNQEPLSIRFFVKYNVADTIPSVTNILINGKEICEPQVFQGSNQMSQLYISNPDSPSNNINHRSSTTTEASNEDGDFFGDFSPNRKPLTAQNLPRDESCGTVTVRARPLITHGQSTSQGEWPWHVAVYRYKGVDMQYICGGTLISRNHILTAAHCVTNSITGLPIQATKFVIYLGKHNLHQLNKNVQNLQAIDVIVHPSFNASYFRNDLAILKLDRPAEITDYVRTICLWEDDVNLNSVLDKVGTIVGWGFDQSGHVTENLMQAKMPVVSTETCIYSNRDFFSRFTSEKTYCAGYRNGTSACTGDSGGGMVFRKTSTSDSNTIWQLRGIVSLSSALQNERVVCDTSNYIVFTDIAKHLNWIHESLREL